MKRIEPAQIATLVANMSSAETRRVDALVMSIFLVGEWTFKEHSIDSSELNQVREVQLYNFRNSPEYARVWGERKQTFDSAFIKWMEDNVVNP